MMRAWWVRLQCRLLGHTWLMYQHPYENERWRVCDWCGRREQGW